MTGNPTTPVRRLAIVGPSRAGKDTAANWFAAHTGLRYTGSCSSIIAPHAAARLGIPEAEAFATRHACRDLWRAIGDELRRDDPAYLARKTLEHGDICVGIRSAAEMEAVMGEGLVDEVLWIDRPGLPVDPTLEFTMMPGMLGMIEMSGVLSEFKQGLHEVAVLWGMV